MRSRALVLGALAQPFKSLPLFIGDAERWRARISLYPKGVILSDEVELTVELSDGERVKVPLRDSVEISGSKVSASILREIQGTRRLSIILEEA